MSTARAGYSSGTDGLRAGWSALLFIVIFLSAQLAVVYEVLSTLMHGHLAGPEGSAVATGCASISNSSRCLWCLLATGSWRVSKVARLAVYGYAGRAKLVRFLWGGVWGFIAITGWWPCFGRAICSPLTLAICTAFAAWKYGLMWLVMFVCTGIFEESLLRGYLQYTLTRGIGFWWGALLMSIALRRHPRIEQGESPVGLFSAGAVGLVFCISLWYTGSLWWAIGFHAVWDWGQTFFYGTPDSGMVARGHLFSEHPAGALLWSGGPTGPEGSLYIVPLLLIMALAMWLWWRRRGVTAPYDQNA